MPRTARAGTREPTSGDRRAETSKWQGLEIESRRLLAEFWGAFLLTLVAAGAGALHRIDAAKVSASAAAVAPAGMVLAAIYFMGGVSGAHINPAVTLAFALRRNFPWIRVPGYIAVQLLGGVAAAALLFALLGPAAGLGASSPGDGVSLTAALVVETLLTTVLVNTILGTASQSGFLGPHAAIPVGTYIALAGLWASPLSGASMNPARSIGPDVVRGDLSHTWIYVAGPLLGAILGVGLEWALKGAPSRQGAKAAQGEDHAQTGGANRD